MEQSLKENRGLRDLLAAIVSLQSRNECARFFRDLCTVRELATLAERWEVVQLIDQGIPYREISERTGASTTTVTRVAHWLRYGEGGYRLMLDRISASRS